MEQIRARESVDGGLAGGGLHRDHAILGERACDEGVNLARRQHRCDRAADPIADRIQVTIDNENVLGNRGRVEWRDRNRRLGHRLEQDRGPVRSCSGRGNRMLRSERFRDHHRRIEWDAGIEYKFNIIEAHVDRAR